MSQTRDSLVESKAILKDIRNYFKHINISATHKQKLFELLEADKNSEFESLYSKIEIDADTDPRERILTSYAIIAIFFTDLYLTLRQYGEFYYKYEGINVNIKLPENTFHRQIPPSTIKIYSDTDRRAAFINFKCKDPTAHKIAVLILKDFEKKMNKIEESFRILGLKIYYLIPKIDKDNYNLENFNFEAYIPTLLPLLTGDNLYKQKEVFIRELIQNSIDAILLRDKLESEPFDKTIKIELGNEINPKDESLRKYLRITDEGIGMDTFKVERYFTSIGRSFYVSEEFSDLMKNKEINFEPISSFGIGFLSVFMVCKEINVITKSYDNNDLALEINIPNYDGCFFINNIGRSGLSKGTSITLYDDERKRLDFKETVKYIKDSILDIQLKIDIINTENRQTEEILPFKLRRDKELVLFVPMDDNGLRSISWNQEVKTGEYIEKYNYGLLIEFDPKVNPREKKDYKIYLNSGIRLSQNNDSFFESFNCTQYYNFPASYIQLDVAREKINSVKSKCFENKKMLLLLSEQANELITHIKEEKNELPLYVCDSIYLFFRKNGFPKGKLIHIKNKLFHLNIKRNKQSLLVKFKANDDDINKESIIDYEFNGSFDVVNLLLLKCYSLRKRFKRTRQSHISEDYDNYQVSSEDYVRYHVSIKKIDEIAKELFEMNSVSLSSFLESTVSLFPSYDPIEKPKLLSCLEEIANLDARMPRDYFTQNTTVFQAFYETIKDYMRNYERMYNPHKMEDPYYFGRSLDTFIFDVPLDFKLRSSEFQSIFKKGNLIDIDNLLNFVLEEAFCSFQDKKSDYGKKSLEIRTKSYISEWYMTLHFLHLILKQVLPGSVSDFKIECIYPEFQKE